MKLKCTVFKASTCLHTRYRCPKDTSAEAEITNRPFAACHSRGTKLPKVALGQHQQKADIILNGNFLFLSCPSATLRPSMTVLYHENGKLQRAYFPSRKDYSSKGVLTRDQIRTCNWTIIYLLWYVWVLECYFCWELGRVSRDEIYSWVWGAIVIITRTTIIINSASNNSLLYIEDITRWREDMNFMFERQEQYLTSERSERVRYCFCHENIKFISWANV